MHAKSSIIGNPNLATMNKENKCVKRSLNLYIYIVLHFILTKMPDTLLLLYTTSSKFFVSVLVGILVTFLAIGK